MAETYTADQLKVIRTIKREARKRYADDPSKRRRRELTAYTIGRVESNFVNVKGGDADSTNWRQERTSIYGGDMSITRSVNRVFDEMDQHDRGQNVGELAADVQRPRADLRGKYAQHLDEARSLAGSSTKPGRSAAGGTPGKVEPGTPPKLTPGKTETDKRAALVDALLEPGEGALLKRWQTRLRSGEYTTSTPAKMTPGKPAKPAPVATGSPRASSDLVSNVQSVDRLAASFGVPVTAKQEPGHTAGGDHDPAVKGASARDYGGDEARREKLFKEITRRLGVKNAKYKGPDINVVVDGVRWQIISRDHGSGPHLHVGWRYA